MTNFQARVNGKWILAGEHAVIRGSPALVFPLYSRYLDFSYTAVPRVPGQALELELVGEHGEELHMLFWGVLEKACSLKGIARQELQGFVKMHSTIPVGAGLGASAALSVAVARWFQHLKILQEEELLEFSRQLENLFHGESSGVDLAVALSGKPLRFVRAGAVAGGGSTGAGTRSSALQTAVIQPKWTPKWYVSYSGKRGVTMECVNQVKQLIKNDPVLGARIDQDMQTAVAQAERALATDSSEAGLPALAAAIDLAKSCFDRWGLTDGNPEMHMRWLKDHGALAVKPTGSGNGGYVLSLWSQEPDPATAEKLIPCF